MRTSSIREVEIVLWLGNRVCWLFQVGNGLGIDGLLPLCTPGEWADNASPTVILKSICDSIESINTDLDCAHELPEFWLNRDQLPVLPALMSVLDQYEEDIIDASNAEWEEWIGFLKSKCPDVRKKQMIQ